MNNYLSAFRGRISLRGLTDHTLKNYCTYIRAYLDYLSDILHKAPGNVSWAEMRGYIHCSRNPEHFLPRKAYPCPRGQAGMGGTGLPVTPSAMLLVPTCMKTAWILLTIKALLGHRSLNSTTIYVHLAGAATGSAVSPFDRMAGVSHGQV